MSNNIPAGWYPNPDANRPGTVKWWDGTNWTEYEHTDYSGIDLSRVSKKEARDLVPHMLQNIQYLEDIINQQGLRRYEDFDTWSLEQTDILNDEKSKIKLDIASLHEQRMAVKKGVDAEVASRTEELRTAAQKIKNEIASRNAELHKISQEIDTIRKDLVDLKDTQNFQNLGFFDYDHPADVSPQLATELAFVRSQIKNMIREKIAATSMDGFTFNNSLAQGKRLSNALTRLLLRAYNAEAENAVKATKAGNLETAQARLSRAADQIAKNGSMIDLRISDSFHRLRLQEIELANRHLKAVQREKETERERRAELREQRKVERELKQEQDRLEKEKSHYEATIAALRAKGDDEGVGRMLVMLEDVDRAIHDVDYRAANIRAGYVYVISNVGSFGSEVVKIGMTRRLEPMDRVRELGDASVPFRFDVHALFFAQDAVSVENLLHKEFAHCRINQVNLRREFFETTPQAVLETLQKQNVAEVVEFTVEQEASEYNESLAIHSYRSANL